MNKRKLISGSREISDVIKENMDSLIRKKKVLSVDGKVDLGKLTEELARRREASEGVK